MIKKLAKITDAGLEIQERGILSFNIFVKYEEGCNQNIGGLCLDTYDTIKKTRVGTDYGCEMIRQILLHFGVDDFSELKGKHLWVYVNQDTLAAKVLGFSCLNVDKPKSETKPVIYKDIYEEFVK